MKEEKSILEVEGLRVLGRNWPDVVLREGDVGGYRLGNGEEAEGLMDAILGIAAVERGSIRWFGQKVEGMNEKQICKNLRQVMPLTIGGGLLENLPVYENILLPAVARNRRSAAKMEEKLYELVEGGIFGHGKETMGLLPYQLSEMQRCSVGFLRAMLCRPAALVVCDIFRGFDTANDEILEKWVELLRRELVETAWFLLHSQTELPAGIPLDSLQES